MISLKFATSLYNLFLYIPITLFLFEESSYKPSTSLLKQINKQQKKLYSFTDLWKVTKFTYKFAKEMLNWIWRVQFRIFHIFLGKRWAGANEEFPSSPKKPPSFHSPLHNCFHKPAFLILSRNCGPGPHLRWVLSTLVASLFKWNLAKIPIRYQEPRRIDLKNKQPSPEKRCPMLGRDVLVTGWRTQSSTPRRPVRNRQGGWRIRGAEWRNLNLRDWGRWPGSIPKFNTYFNYQFISKLFQVTVPSHKATQQLLFSFYQTARGKVETAPLCPAQ